PEQLGVAGGGAAALGVEVDPATVRGVLGAVAGGLTVGQLGAPPALGGDRKHLRRHTGAVGEPLHGHISEGRAVRADSVQEVQVVLVLGDAGGGAAGERSPVDVAVVGGDVDVVTVGAEHVIVVQRRQIPEIDPLRLAAGGRETE